MIGEAALIWLGGLIALALLTSFARKIDDVSDAMLILAGLLLWPVAIPFALWIDRQPQ